MNYFLLNIESCHGISPAILNPPSHTGFPGRDGNAKVEDFHLDNHDR